MEDPSNNDEIPAKPEPDQQPKRENPSIGENEEFAEIEVFEYEYADIEVKRSGPDKNKAANCVAAWWRS